MTYLRSYVNEMLNKHPQGEEFRLIRKLAKRAGNLYPQEKTELEHVSLELLNIAIFAGSVAFPERRASRIFGLDHCFDFTPDPEKRHQLFEALRTKVSALIKLINTSENSQWLARYMIEEGVSNCDVAQEIFKEYLEACKDQE